MREPEKFDFIVLGGGSAGYAGARTAVELGRKVAVVDGAAELGGLCILRGCMPSKTLIYSAEVLHLAQKGDLFGFKGERPVADLAAMQERKRAVIKEFSDYRQQQLQDGRFSLFRKFGKFRDRTTVELSDGQILQGDKILISTGSSVKVPQLQGFSDCSYKTSDDLLSLDYLPPECVVLGGGVVACELAQFLVRVGSNVVQLQRSSHILKEFAEESSQVVEDTIRSEGIDLRTGVSLQAFESLGNNRTRIRFDHQGKSQFLETSFLFNALGRVPATRNLNLDNAAIELLPSGHIQTNQFQQSSQPNIYAAGDCAGPHEVVHIAIKQGETAARHAFNQTATPIDYDHLLNVVFTDPQVTKVGLNPDQMSERGLSPILASFPFDDHGKSILMEAKSGYVAVHADRATGQIYGAECVSKDAGELIHALSIAISLGATAKNLLKADWYHPTLSEIWTYPLEEIVEQTKE